MSMIKLLSTTTILFVLLFSHNLHAQDDDKAVTITVSGNGKTLDEAKQSGLRSAIEQAFGVFISSRTDVLNDQVVADQITSLANGNIQSFEVLNESQFPNGSWGVTLKTMVSIGKLKKFVQAKGISIEIKGGLFAVNIKQQLLNEQSEIKAVCEMVFLLHETMQIAFDYEIKSGEPKSLDSESKNWAIPLQVIATANKNMDFCADYCIKTLSALSLTDLEVENYKSLQKQIFHINISFNGKSKRFYLRKNNSIIALNVLINNWEFYTRSFIIKSGMDETIGNGKGNIHEFGEIIWTPANYDNEDGLFDGKSINYLSSGKIAATYSWEDKRTLQQIEQMTGYTVMPSEIRSKFKHGGYVVFEENGHGLVAAIFDLERSNCRLTKRNVESNGFRITLAGELSWSEAQNGCDELILNGYSDWRLPTIEELNLMYVNLQQKGIGGFYNANYWSSTPNGGDTNFYKFKCFGKWKNDNYKSGEVGYSHIDNKKYVRAVRTF